MRSSKSQNLSPDASPNPSPSKTHSTRIGVVLDLSVMTESSDYDGNSTDDDSFASDDSLETISEEVGTLVQHCKIASCRADIVEMEHYSGKALVGKLLHLVREPKNPHDQNALCVRNLQGEKVGYIMGPFAKKISPLLDTYQWKEGMSPEWGLSVEGKVLKYDEGTSALSSDIDFFVVGRASSANELLGISQSLTTSLNRSFGRCFCFGTTASTSETNTYSKQTFSPKRNQWQNLTTLTP